MKDKMKKKEIRKIEDELSDIEVPDSVLNLARVQMSKADKEQKPAVRKFNLKIALSCAASFVLCLAIILPVSLSSFDKGGNGNPPDSSAGTDLPPADGAPCYRLSQLDKEKIYPEITDGEHSSGSGEPLPPPDNEEKIEYLSHTVYSSLGTEIISEKTYSVYDTVCTVYTLYNPSYRVDVLESFNGLTGEYSVVSINVNYKVDGGSYFAEADYKNQNYYFTGKFAKESHFEEFCRYLFQ